MDCLAYGCVPKRDAWTSVSRSESTNSRDHPVVPYGLRSPDGGVDGTAEENRTINYDASVRHFRAYTRKKGGFIEATPLKQILMQTPEWNPDLYDGATIAQRVVWRLFVDKAGAATPGQSTLSLYACFPASSTDAVRAAGFGSADSSQELERN